MEKDGNNPVLSAESLYDNATVWREPAHVMLPSNAANDVLPSDAIPSTAAYDVVQPKASSDVVQPNASSDVVQSNASSDVVQPNASDAVLPDMFKGMSNLSDAVAVVGGNNINIQWKPEICVQTGQEAVIPSNVKAQMEAELKKTSDIFLRTVGFTNCLDTLRMHGSVVITAHPGDGKTTLATGLARYLKSTAWDDGILYKPLVIQTADEWRRYVDPKKNQVVIIDDMFGIHNLSTERFHNWLSVLQTIEACLEENRGCFLVIITSRKSIFYEAKNHLARFRLFEPEKVVDLSEECNLTKDDMMRMATVYKQRAKLELSDRLVSDIVFSTKRQGFPRMCEVTLRLGADVDQLQECFKNTANMDILEIQVISRDSIMQKALLWLCLFAGGELDVDEVTRHGLSERQRKVVEYAGVSSGTTFVQISQSGQSIPECYLKRDFRDDRKLFKFSHPSVLLAVAKTFAQEHMKVFIRDSFFGLITDIVRLQTDDRHDPTTAIELKAQDQILLVNRFVTELQMGKSYEVCSHPAFSCQNFVALFLDVITQACRSGLLFPNDKGQLSFLYWTVWNKEGRLCKGVLKHICRRKLKKSNMKDIFTAVIGACVSGNGDALSALVGVLPSDKLKKYLKNIKDFRNLMLRTNGSFSSILQLAFIHRNANCVEVILKHQQACIEINEVRTLLSMSIKVGMTTMFLTLLKHVPSEILKDLLIQKCLTLPLTFKNSICQIVTYIISDGAEVLLTIWNDFYRIACCSWKSKQKHTEVEVRRNSDTSIYEVHMCPCSTIYAKQKQGYDPQTELYEAIAADLHVAVEIMLELSINPNIESVAYKETALYTCCRLNRLDMILCLLQHGAEVNLSIETTKQTPLYAACRAGHVDAALLLLGNGAKWNVQNESRDQILRLACTRGDTDVVELLINTGVDVNLRWKDCHTPLGLACSLLDECMVAKLLDLGANVDMESGMEHNTPLVISCKTLEGIFIVKILISHRANVNKASGLLLPLEQACENWNEELVKLLLDEGASFYPDQRVCEELLTTACRRYKGAIVKVFLEKFNSFDTSTPLCVAGAGDDVSTAEVLLEAGADVNQICANNKPLFHIACEEWSNNIVNCLIQYGADVNLWYHQLAPLYFACQKDRQSLVEILCFKRANVNLYYQEGLTALHIACSRGNMAIVQTLLYYGAKVDSKTIAVNETPMSIACRNGHFDLVKELLHSGADVKAKAGEREETPLLICCNSGSVDILQMLLCEGALADERSGVLRDTPLLHLCRMYRQPEPCRISRAEIRDIVLILIHYYADVNIHAVTDGRETPLGLASGIADDGLATILKNNSANVLV